MVVTTSAGDLDLPARRVSRWRGWTVWAWLGGIAASAANAVGAHASGQGDGAGPEAVADEAIQGANTRASLHSSVGANRLTVRAIRIANVPTSSTLRDLRLPAVPLFSHP